MRRTRQRKRKPKLATRARTTRVLPPHRQQTSCRLTRRYLSRHRHRPPLGHRLANASIRRGARQRSAQQTLLRKLAQVLSSSTRWTWTFIPSRLDPHSQIQQWRLQQERSWRSVKQQQRAKAVLFQPLPRQRRARANNGPFHSGGAPSENCSAKMTVKVQPRPRHRRPTAQLRRPRPAYLNIDGRKTRTSDFCRPLLKAPNNKYGRT